MSEPKPTTTGEIAEALRGNLCHGNCLCVDEDWCIQEIAANELDRLNQQLQQTEKP